MTIESMFDIDDLEEFTNTIYDKIARADNSEEINQLKDKLLDKWKRMYLNAKNEAECNIINTKMVSNKQTNLENSIIDILGLHLLMNNEHDVFESLLEEKPNGTILNDLVIRYNDMQEIEIGIKEENFTKLEFYIKENKEYFKNNKKLPFYHKAFCYLKIIKNKDHTNAFLFANEYFAEFININSLNKEIKQLVGFIIIANSKEQEVLLKKYRRAIYNQFKNDYTIICDIPKHDPLNKVLLAGTDAINAIKNTNNSFGKKDFPVVDFTEELPFELDVKQEHHSIFICPVLKTFCDDNNPPSMLPCGHVISKYAVEKLSKNGEMVTFKCPYCPIDCQLSKIKPLKL